MYRRQFLYSTALISAGCIRSPPADFPRRKELEIYVPDLQEKNEELVLSGRVKNKPTYEEGNNYHNVALVAYDESGELLCKSSIGTVPGYETKQYTLSCEEIPHTITATAEEDPCEDPVKIRILVYEGVTDGRQVWDGTRFRQCNEELPPTYSETEDR